MKMVHMAAYTLLWVGGLNWGLLGLFKFNLVETIFGVGSTLTMLVYILVGVAAVYSAATHMKECKVCSEKA